MSKAVSTDLTFVEHHPGCGCSPCSPGQLGQPGQPSPLVPVQGTAVASGYEPVDKSGRCGCCSSYYRSVWDRLCQQLFGYIPAGMDTEDILRGLVIWTDGVERVGDGLPATFRVTATGQRTPLATDIIYYKEAFYNIGAVSSGASNVYTCTECLPIEASVIEAYKTLVATNARLEANETVRRDRANQDHARADEDHGVAAADHQQYGNDHFTAGQDHAGYEADHERAANDHTAASGDRTRAAEDHSRADADHSTAQEDHNRAGNDHLRAESDHARSEQDHRAVANAVLFTPQTLTEEEQAQARENIGVEGTGTDTEAVHFTPQSLTDSQKLQARTNIGATAPEVFWAEYGATTFADVKAAKDAGKIVAVNYNDHVYLVSFESSAQGSPIYFSACMNARINFVRVYPNNTWSAGNYYLEERSNKSQSVETDKDSTTKYPSTKAVADAITAGKQIFWAEYGVTTYADIVAAATSGKFVVALYNDREYVLTDTNTLSSAWFLAGIGTQVVRLRCTNTNQWSNDVVYIEITSNKSQSVETDKTSTTHYPSTKAVWDGLKVRPVIDETSQETVPSLNLENTANKSQDVQTDRESIVKYPSVKAVFDSLGKWGVISQTQTWTGSDTTGYDYTMSNPVWGIIPQEFIFRATSHPQVVFNETTGYFELNGINDISYKEMMVILEDFTITMGYMANTPSVGQVLHGRTFIPDNNTGTISLTYACFNRGYLEVVTFGYTDTSSQVTNNISSMCRGDRRLRKISGLSITATSSANVDRAFENCYTLETAFLLGLRVSLGFGQSSRVSLASVVYMVDNAANTSAITITLHATAYARCQSDTTEYTYNGNTYTGIIALATAKNISIASA